MAEDKEVLREVWDGKIPIRFELASNEVASVEPPDPFFLLVPRLTYITLVTEKVKRHFQRAVAETESGNEIWFEFDGLPLKWHFPVGLLFDLLSCNTALPWNVIVHFQRFPDQELMHCPGEETIEAHFMSTIKEADCLKHRSSVMNGMTQRDHAALWSGLKNDRFDLFWNVNKRLMTRTNPSEQPNFRAIPIRIYQSDRPYLQPFFRPTEDERMLTLRDLLAAVIPDALPESGKGLRVVINGIEPPLDSSMHWLSEHLSHPDNFLHIAVVSSDSDAHL